MSTVNKITAAIFLIQANVLQENDISYVIDIENANCAPNKHLSELFGYQIQICVYNGTIWDTYTFMSATTTTKLMRQKV